MWHRESKWEAYLVALLEYLACCRFLLQLLFIFFIFGWHLSAFSVFWAANNTWNIIHVKKSRGRRTLAHGVRPYLRSKELTERWVCPFSCCEWRDHLSYPSTLPVARPGSRGGRWLSLLSFFTRLHHKHFFYYPLPTSPFGVFSLLTFPAGCYSVMMVFSFFFQRTPRCCAVYHTKPWIFFE